MARRLVLRLGVIGVVRGAVESCATSGGALFHLIGLACQSNTECGRRDSGMQRVNIRGKKKKRKKKHTSKANLSSKESKHSTLNRTAPHRTAHEEGSRAHRANGCPRTEQNNEWNNNNHLHTTTVLLRCIGRVH